MCVYFLLFWVWVVLACSFFRFLNCSVFRFTSVRNFWCSFKLFWWFYHSLHYYLATVWNFWHPVRNFSRFYFFPSVFYMQQWVHMMLVVRPVLDLLLVFLVNKLPLFVFVTLYPLIYYNEHNFILFVDNLLKKIVICRAQFSSWGFCSFRNFLPIQFSRWYLWFYHNWWCRLGES